ISEFGDYDLIISKINRSGDELWTQTLDINGGDDAAVDIALDANNNIFLVGSSYDSETDLAELLVVHYDNSGNLQWSENYSAPNSVYNVGTSITTDGTNLYIGGTTFNMQYQSDFLALSYSASNGNLNWDYSWDNIGLNDIVTSIYRNGSKLYLA
ncbi:MAG: hypothetical protein ABR574_13410, partial [Cryomorphaceae bacterium]